jgi:hypothetical protein
MAEVIGEHHRFMVACALSSGRSQPPKEANWPTDGVPLIRNHQPQASKGVDVHELAVMKEYTASRAIHLAFPVEPSSGQWSMNIPNVSLGTTADRLRAHLVFQTSVVN